VRIPIKATAREPIKQAGYISATSAFYAQSLLRNAAGPYISAQIRSLTARFREMLPNRTDIPVDWAYGAMIGAMLYFVGGGGRLKRVRHGRADPDDWCRLYLRA
jgi:hypothetical protein